MKFKHYSFDLWLTLIRSNPQFKTERQHYFHKHFNSLDKSLEEVGMVFRQVDVIGNKINEKSGQNLKSEELYLLVILLLNGPEYSFDTIDLQRLENEMDALVLNYHPVLYDSHVKQNLDLLKREVKTMSILSNTGFIKGKVLRQVLDNLSIGAYFDFQLYSDEEGMSKPNPDFFAKMVQKVAALYPDLNVNPKDIVHIGDNPVADLQGAQYLNLPAVIVNSNQFSLSEFLQSCA